MLCCGGAGPRMRRYHMTRPSRRASGEPVIVEEGRCLFLCNVGPDCQTPGRRSPTRASSRPLFACSKPLPS